ncbi:hypothetical protein BWZ20_05845 [Winogradskyella sp. J14-2]|nr:hypothetical protein BWZ20_05845 [Winogradskyella sp. J14-2]
MTNFSWSQAEWTGAGDGYSWDDPYNWLDEYVPTTGDDIYIDGGSPNYISEPETYGTLELANGSNLLIQGDLYLSGDIIIDATSVLSADVYHLNDMSKIFASSYVITGDIDILFSGYVPQIGNAFQIINASLGGCGLATTDLVEEGQATGFNVLLGVQCQNDGVVHTVIDINYTTAIAWDGEGGDNQWTNAANWDPNGVPAIDDVVIINLPGSGGIVNTQGAGITQANQILIGDNNTLIINSDLRMFSVIQMSDAASIIWNAGELSKSNPSVTSAIINYGTIILDSPGLKSIDDNFEIWNYSVIDHNQGNLNINNGNIINYNDSEYNINGDNINIAYTLGTNHSLENYGASTISKTSGSGTSSINLSNFLNYANVRSQSGVLSFGEDLNSEFGSVGGAGATQFPSGYIYDGVLSPGNSPGVLIFVGDLETSTSAIFNIEIDGPNAGTEYDQIIVTNNADLNGDIQITLGYLPANDASFEIVSAGTLTSCSFPQQITANFNGMDYTFNVVCQNNSLYLNGPGAVLSTSNINISEVILYPNPVLDAFNIELKFPYFGNWQLHNTFGQHVLEGKLNGLKTKVSTKELESGIYLLQITDDNHRNSLVKKIIKI